MLLAMHGADVVKLEPLEGDWSRGLGTQYAGQHTAMSAHNNRGKKSLALDLKSPAAREIAVMLADRADIVIEGFRPGVADRLGFGFPGHCRDGAWSTDRGGRWRGGLVAEPGDQWRR